MAKRLSALLFLQRDNPDLLRAQLNAFSRQMPLLYLTLLVNACAVAATHMSSAPATLTIIIPALLGIICVVRLVVWWRTRAEKIDDRQAHRRLCVTIALTTLLGTSFVAWSFALFPYGDAYQQSHVAFFMAMSIVASTFCLMHVRQAAFALLFVSVVPFAIYFGTSGNAVFGALAINLVLVAFAMIVILLGNYKTFAAMVAQRKELIARQAETQRLSDDNLRLANLDSLTELPNRRMFFTRLEAELEARRTGRFAVGLVDLDGFKPVNDLFGHAVGDKVLVEVGRRLLRFSGQSCFVSRLGGDEFGLLISGDVSPDALMVLGREICAALDAPYVMAEATAKLSGSIGFAIHPDHGADPQDLVERADYALYQAKHSCRGLPVLFSEGLATELRRMNEVEQALLRCDLETDLSIVFQPVVDPVSERVLGFEALARWQSAALGEVPPHVFIRIAERTDMINRVTAALLAKTLRAAASWPSDVGVSFNLSMRDLSSNASMLRIVSMIEQSGIDPCRIVFEITESALLHDFEQAAEALRMLKRLGVRIALDDFGTGYSSLGYVHRLPLDRIKIDRSFIVRIVDDPVSRSIVKTVLDLCENLGLDCVVEGVETDEQVALLREFGCGAMQGYYFSPPVPFEATHDLLADRPIALHA